MNCQGIEYEATARGKFKNEAVKPVVGDNVEIEEILDGKAVIQEILERKNMLKRPKVSNISQIVFVISPKMPKPNFLMIDKELCYAELMGIHPIIVINKMDLDEKAAKRMEELYTKTGYQVIKTKAEFGEGIEALKKVLLGQTTVLAGSSGVRKIDNYQSNIR